MQQIYPASNALKTSIPIIKRLIFTLHFLPKRIVNAMPEFAIKPLRQAPKDILPETNNWAIITEEAQLGISPTRVENNGARKEFALRKSDNASSPI